MSLQMFDLEQRGRTRAVSVAPTTLAGTIDIICTLPHCADGVCKAHYHNTPRITEAQWREGVRAPKEAVAAAKAYNKTTYEKRCVAQQQNTASLMQDANYAFVYQVVEAVLREKSRSRSRSPGRDNKGKKGSKKNQIYYSY